MWWQWLIFIAAAIIMPISLAYTAVQIKKRNNLNEKQEKTLNLNIGKYTMFYWLCDLFYMSFIIDSLVWKYIFGGLIMLIIFYNLISAFLNQATQSHNGIVKWSLLQDFIVGAGISVYLIFIISDSTLQTIVTAIVAALYGGLFTLVGVAWTIKHTEYRAKLEERQKARPLFAIIDDMSSKVEEANKNIKQFSQERNDIFATTAFVCNLQNTEKSVFFINKISIAGKFYYPDSSFLISKDEKFQIVIMNRNPNRQTRETIRIYVSDANYEDYIYDVIAKDSVYEKIAEVTDE